MAASVLRKNEDLSVQWNIPKNEIGELKDYEVPLELCQCNKVHKNKLFS